MPTEKICEATDSNSQSPLPICEIVDSSTQSSPPPPLPSEDNKDLEEELNIDAPWRRKLSLKTKYIESSDLANHHPVNLNIPVIFSENEGTPERQYISKASWKPFYSNGCLNVTPSSTKPFERRATSFKEVRFKVDPETETSKGEEQKLKRRCRRSNTNNLPNPTHSRSILERQSARKGRLSSPEFETFESHEVRMAPRYFLRTCRAGTLVVAEESGRYKRTRRRIRKTSSTENVLSHSSSSLLRQKGILNSSLGDPCSQSQSVKNFGEYNGSRSRRKAVPIRRHRSDGNILLVTSSEEDNCDRRKMKNRSKNTVWRHKNGDVKTYEDSNE
ncbi:uncharacterized protein LOC129947798 isoform X2 [Eupeodes corollae]|uniref:uncharacterized protein LOC129947798 isoform X2 n=1 Tax=Eupeodes corollae TaxID=290404 RepID=UPI0024938114|nr:uncharacterized protein LOC129947798 isoform X2 [Eupeodes corollae]